MADLGLPLSLTGPNRPDAKMVWGWVARGEVALAIGIVGIIVLLILPAPAILLDLLLAMSITAAVLILMTAVLIRKPLEFSAFPTVLLVATLYRLGLNIASARLILSRGHEGTEAAGHVIQAFGQLMMQGDFVIGVIVFAILLVVNFIVITKGSTRIAEVAARFTLDAMPGKQMAIDADLGTGLIDETEAKRRRKELEQESTFFGAMDGASKFVRGDAMAGLIITGINIVGGIIIGVVQHHVPLAQAFSTYTIMTIGDGLVTQVPALVISIAAGFLVSKAGVEGPADKALVNQLAMNPISLGMVSAASGVIAFVPGMPIIPFAAIAAGAGALAWKRGQDAKKAEEEANKPKPAAASANEGQDEEPIASALAIDDVKIELGYGLLSLINDLEGRRLTDQIRALRRTLAADFGFVMPPVRILDNMRLANQGYAIRIKEMENGAGEVRLGMLLAMDPRGMDVSIPGEQVREPAFGLPATWIDEGLREEATFRGYTIVDPATVLTTHLTEILKDNMADLLSYAEVQKLLKELPGEQKKLVDDLVPGVVSVTTIQRVLQALLRERVSIRDLPQILEGIAEAAGSNPTVALITEHVRSRLARQLCFANKGDDGTLAIITLSPDWEAAFADALTGTGDEKQLAMAPSHLQEFIKSVRENFERAGQAGDMPVLLTGPVIRPYVRQIVERFRPQTVVMSQNEIHPKARLKTVGVV
jgi:flagellar biosynthesis protein FlhA